MMGRYCKDTQKDNACQRPRHLPLMFDQAGETLLELVISIGLFAITMLMVATMFVVANKTTKRNFDAEVQVDKVVSDTVKEENIDNRQNVTVVFSKDGGGTVQKEVERIEVRGLYKYRKKP